MKRSEFPDWVINALPPGCIVKQQGEHYYVYKRTSQRVKGMKYPQPKDVYVGRISEDRGFVQKEKILVEYSNVETYELGMSYAIIHCCPDGWKQAIGTNSETMLYAVIKDLHADTYLSLPEYGLSDKYGQSITSEAIQAKVKVQRANLYRRFREAFQVSKEELDSLSDIRLVVIDSHRVISAVKERPRTVLNKLGLEIKLEVR